MNPEKILFLKEKLNYHHRKPVRNIKLIHETELELLEEYDLQPR